MASDPRAMAGVGVVEGGALSLVMRTALDLLGEGLNLGDHGCA